MTDDKIAEIRARHSRDDRWRNLPSMICPQAHDDRALLLAEIERLREELEVERLRLAACDVVAMADTLESAIEARQIKLDYRSAALTRVESRVDEVIALRAEIERLRADLATQQGCCDGAAAQDAHVRREREEHKAEIERLRADRRERIATAALQGLLSEGDLRGEPQIWAKRATVFADALIAELDKEEAKP